MTLKERIEAAIARSISHNETVDVDVDGTTEEINDAVRIINHMADEMDSARMSACIEDVWGEIDGDTFRLSVYKA